MKDTIHIALTGHRPNMLAGYDMNRADYKRLQSDLEQYILFTLTKVKHVVCHTGMALGADTLWALAIDNVKSIYADRVYRVNEIPMITQADKWSTYDKELWKQLYNSADKNNIYDQDTVTTTNRQTAAKAMFMRNHGMVDSCDILLALLWSDKTTGGTYKTVEYARKHGKHVVIINPEKYFQK